MKKGKNQVSEQGRIKVSYRQFAKMEKELFEGGNFTLEAWMELCERYEVQPSPLAKTFCKIKEALGPKKEMGLGKINVYDEMPTVKGIDKRVAWSADEYLAAIIRDYIRMIEKRERHIGAAAFDEFPIAPHDKRLDCGEQEEVAAAKRWHEILLETADMFDGYLKATRAQDREFDYREHLDKTFDNLKKIFMDLWV